MVIYEPSASDITAAPHSQAQKTRTKPPYILLETPHRTHRASLTRSPCSVSRAARTCSAVQMYACTPRLGPTLCPPPWFSFPRVVFHTKKIHYCERGKTQDGCNKYVCACACVCVRVRVCACVWGVWGVGGHCAHSLTSQTFPGFP